MFLMCHEPLHSERSVSQWSLLNIFQMYIVDGRSKQSLRISWSSLASLGSQSLCLGAFDLLEGSLKSSSQPLLHNHFSYLKFCLVLHSGIFVARLHHFSPEGHGSVALLVGFLRVKNAGCKGHRIWNNCPLCPGAGSKWADKWWNGKFQNEVSMS